MSKTYKTMRNSTQLLALLLMLLSMTNCSNQEKNNQITDASILIEIDKKFSKLSQSDGMGKAFIDYADDNAMILQNGSETLLGIDQIKKRYSRIPSEKIKLEWEPLRADISSSGDMGYTYGKYKLTIKDSTDIISYGKYLSIWKLQSDGSWKYVADVGVDG